MDRKLKADLIKFIRKCHKENDGFNEPKPSKDTDDEDIINFVIVRDSEDRRQDDYRIPLISALIIRGEIDLAKQLLEVAGLSVAVTDNRNHQTPLDYARQNGNAELIELLEIRVANPLPLPQTRNILDYFPNAQQEVKEEEQVANDPVAVLDEQEQEIASSGESDDVPDQIG